MRIGIMVVSSVLAAGLAYQAWYVRAENNPESQWAVGLLMVSAVAILIGLSVWHFRRPSRPDRSPST